MNNIDRIMRVVTYIEENLSEEMDWKKASQAGFYSKFHLHRIFSALTGETLGAYLRKRKLTLAAEKLQSTNDSILDISEMSGFSSQASFTRAFKSQFHIPPAEFRNRPNQGLEFACLPLTLKQLQSFIGGKTMEPIIKEFKEMFLVGMERITVPHDSKIPELWQRFFGRMQEIKSRTDWKTCYGFGIMDEECLVNGFPEGAPFISFVAVEISDSTTIPTGMVARRIPAMKCAVFTHKGSFDTLQKTYKEIYGNWAVNSGYEIAGAFDFELYDSRFNPEDIENSEFDICVPVV